MPRSRKINLKKVRASLDAVCPKCGHVIPPAEAKRSAVSDLCGALAHQPLSTADPNSGIPVKPQNCRDSPTRTRFCTRAYSFLHARGSRDERSQCGQVWQGRARDGSVEHATELRGVLSQPCGSGAGAEVS